MTKKENQIMVFAFDFCKMMDWEFPPITRIKINKMVNYKGWCIPHPYENELYILLSLHANTDNKDFFSTLIHELIHAHLLINTKHHKNAHKHGKIFKRYAKKVCDRTNGYYSVKDIL